MVFNDDPKDPKQASADTETAQAAMMKMRDMFRDSRILTAEEKAKGMTEAQKLEELFRKRGVELEQFCSMKPPCPGSAMVCQTR